MAEVGSGQVAIFPTFHNFRTAVVSEVDSTADAASRSWGERFRGGLGTAVRGAGVAIGATLAAGAAGAGALIATTLSRGLDRALNIQDATAQLDGLGHSAESVDAIMQNALASVRGTAFGLDAAATTAAGAVAAGIAPGEELQRTLTLVADAAATARTPLDEMGSIVNKVATSGRLSTDVLNQFHDRGVPLLQMVAGEYGVTAEAAQEMVSRGEVDFERFQNALETNMGGAALSSGDTARGAFANVGAALGRLGAMFTGGAVAAAPGLFQSISGAIDRAATALAPFAEQFNARLEPAMARLAAWIDTIDFGVVVDQVSGFASQVQSFFSGFGSGSGEASAAFGSIQDSLSRLAPAFGEFGAQLGEAGPAMAELASAGIGLLTDGLSFLADHVGVIVDWMPAIVAGFIAWRVASQATAMWSLNLRAAELAAAPIYLANNVMRLRSATLERSNAAAKALSTAATSTNTAAEATNTGAKSAGMLATIRQTAANVAARVAMIAGAVATGVATAAQWALNAAMSANPIALVVIAIAALVAGLIWFFTQTQLGQEIWANFTRFLGEAWANVSAWFMAVGEGIAAWWNGLWQGISDWFTSVWTGIVTFLTMFVTSLQLIISTALAFISSVWNGAWAAIGDFISTAWSNIVTGVSTGIENVISFVTGIPGRVLSALGDLGSLLLNSGRSLIQGFIDGIRGMIGAVGDAVGGVMDFVGGFFPNSPAKRGPFSGSGWTKLSRSGGATLDQWIGGMDPSRMEDVMRLPAAGASRFGGAAGAGGGTGGSLIENTFNVPEFMSPAELSVLIAQKQAEQLRRVGV